MKNIKKYSLVALLGLSMVAMVACGNDNTSTTPSETESSSELPSEDSSSSSSTQLTKRIKVTLGKETISEGSSFYDGCKPSVMYEDDENPENNKEVNNYTFKTQYSIVNRNDSSLTYAAGDYLPAGSYTANITHTSGRKYRASADFEVVKGNVDVAEEGKGYTTYTTSQLEQYKIANYKGVATLGGNGMPTTGEVKILVIPVQFTNTVFSDFPTVKSILNEAFFGASEDTPWESLSSYYKKASFNKLNITGVVTDAYTYPMADTDVNDGNTDISREIAKLAVEWLKKEKGYDMTEYDADKDGYIDGIEIVYNTSRPTPSADQSSDSSTWWNYTTNVGGTANVSDPGANKMFWSRWDYVTNAYYSSSPEGISLNGKKVDAHTIIHETGHMMGAPDYYSYDKTEGPAGCVDMMDNNVGDHNAYTKMFYNWVAPKVVDGTSDNFTVTLNSYVETGEFLLVPKSSTGWNGSPYDEYLMIEYYTPTGINEMDSTGYPEWQQTSSSGGTVYGHGGTYEKPGVQVFHVDSRTSSTKGKLDDTGRKVSGSAVKDYTDTPRSVEFTDRENKVYESTATLTHDNTPSRSSDGKTGERSDYRLLQAIYPSGVNSTTSSSYYNSFGVMSNLFGASDYRYKDDKTETSYYGGNMYSNYKLRDFFPNDLEWNDGSTNQWNFYVVSQTDSTVTLHFVKN